jgi:hypothetical protein
MLQTSKMSLNLCSKFDKFSTVKFLINYNSFSALLHFLEVHGFYTIYQYLIPSVPAQCKTMEVMVLNAPKLYENWLALYCYATAATV